MAALYTMSVCTAEAVPGTYKRVLVCPDGQSAIGLETKGGTDFAGSSSDGDVTSSESSASDTDDDDDNNRSAQKQYRYSRCVPLRAPDVDYWMNGGDNRGIYNSARASDAGSVVSKRSSNGDKRVPKHRYEVTTYYPCTP
jgi:hypothetical protein